VSAIEGFLGKGGKTALVYARWTCMSVSVCECLCLCVSVCVCVRACVYVLDACMYARWYGVATISGLHKIIGPFCERAL